MIDLVELDVDANLCKSMGMYGETHDIIDAREDTQNLAKSLRLIKLHRFPVWLLLRPQAVLHTLDGR